MIDHAVMQIFKDVFAIIAPMNCTRRICHKERLKRDTIEFFAWKIQFMHCPKTTLYLSRKITWTTPARYCYKFK